MLISVIIPTFDEGEHIPAVLDSLWQQEGELEVIVVDGNRAAGNPALAPNKSKVRVVSAPDMSRGEMLDAGAAEARGEVWLFLWPGSCLPVTALVAVERNFKLLPQSNLMLPLPMFNRREIVWNYEFCPLKMSARPCP